MSQLLDALKKAALEKQKREATVGLSPTELHELDKQHAHLDQQSNQKEMQEYVEEDVGTEDDLSPEFLDIDVDFDEAEKLLSESLPVDEVPEPVATADYTDEADNSEDIEPEAEKETEKEPDHVAADFVKTDPQDSKEKLKKSIIELVELTSKEEKKQKSRRVLGFVAFIVITFCMLIAFYFLVTREVDKSAISVQPRDINIKPALINRFPSTMEEGLQEAAVANIAAENENDLEAVTQDIDLGEVVLEVVPVVISETVTEAAPEVVQEKTPEVSQVLKIQAERELDLADKPPVKNPEPIFIEKKVELAARLNQKAYTAFNEGDLDKAQQFYADAKASDIKNIDARLGLAAIDFQRANYSSALLQYQDLLIVNPDNIYAHEGLMGIAAQAPVNAQYESKLVELIQRYPNAAHLHYVQGVIYAKKGQWTPARNAFSEASQNDHLNANYAYNLAVSLDQLGADDQALINYQRALHLNKNRPGIFDISWVQRRINRLGKR